jgi:hypothetical protein
LCNPFFKWCLNIRYYCQRHLGAWRYLRRRRLPKAPQVSEGTFAEGACQRRLRCLKVPSPKAPAAGTFGAAVRRCGGDGEGCFTCSLLSNSSAIRFRYILTQKWEVNKIVLLWILNNFYPVKGSIVSHHISNVWELRINGLKNCQDIFFYFDNYPLHTKKKFSYLKWKK